MFFKDFGLNNLCVMFVRKLNIRGTHINQKILREEKTPFDLINSNVWGTTPSIDLHGFRWFLVFVDDCSRFGWIYLLKHKSKVTLKIKIFFQMIERQFEKGIKII